MYNNTAVIDFTIKYRGVEQLVARRAHNPEVAGSNPASATIEKQAKMLVSHFLLSTLCFYTLLKNHGSLSIVGVKS